MKGDELVHLIYDGPLYNLNRSNPKIGHLKAAMLKHARRQFGTLPPSHAARVPAQVMICRVLGPRQRFLDDDKNLGNATGQLVDALVQGGWLVDDSPKWATFRFRQDDSRRQLGPRIEIDIHYQAD